MTGKKRNICASTVNRGKGDQNKRNMVTKCDGHFTVTYFMGNMWQVMWMWFLLSEVGSQTNKTHDRKWNGQCPIRLTELNKKKKKKEKEITPCLNVMTACWCHVRLCYKGRSSSRVLCTFYQWVGKGERDMFLGHWLDQFLLTYIWLFQKDCMGWTSLSELSTH